MVNVTIYKKENQITGFEFIGHAGFARRGKDIVCAGISALVVNTINSIEQLTEDKFTCEVEEKSGDVRFHMVDEISDDAQLLLKSLELGVLGILELYKKYITVNFREV